MAFLLSQIGARSAQLFAEQLKPLGISPRAFGVLSNLTGDGSHSQQRLADALGIHRNNMVSLIDEMETAGWVTRHRNDRDRRVFDIQLTAAGSSLVTKVNRLIPTLQEQIVTGLSPTERETMSELLTRIAHTLGLSPGVHPHLARTRPGSKRPDAAG